MEAAQAEDRNYEYDVCLSFAGENRDYVERVADALREAGVRVFYDEHEKAALWGKDLYEHLAWIYRDSARYCVLFASEAYAEKIWTSHERKNAQSRAIEENSEYVLPARFDDTEIPGLLPTVGYIDLASTDPEELAELVKAKLGPRQRSDFFPPNPDVLYEATGASDEESQDIVAAAGHRFFQTLKRMTPEERRVVIGFFSMSCPAELPANVHISLDLLSREVGLPAGQVEGLLGGIHALGYTCLERDPDPLHDKEIRAEDKMLELRWSTLSDIDVEGAYVAHHVVRSVRANYCEEHGNEALMALDFSSLAEATAEEHEH